VLLLEAGPQDTFETIQVPALFSALFGTEVDWNYQIEEQNQYRGSTTYPRGRTLGGSSSINLMVYIRGHRGDFDGWSERGNVGWDYDTIDPAYYTHPADLADITAGLRVALEIANQSPISKYLRCLNLPIEANPSDEALTEHARHWAQTGYHTVGTCAMGIDENAVVDPQLKVRGVDGLRVADASVMPTVVSGNTNGATVMIAEKATDLIKGRATT
jgi:choline dehydrogenase-like flavoprotein